MSSQTVAPTPCRAAARLGRSRAARSRLLAVTVSVAAVIALAFSATPSAHAARSDSVHGRHRAHPGAQHSGVALQWYDITDQTVTAAAFSEPVTHSRTWSVSWLAAARAVRHHHDPAHQIAAFAQALHDTLAAQVPSQQSQLDADLASTLAGVPDGSAKSGGIAAGKQHAASVLAERQGDGLDTASVDIPFTAPPPAPGVWQPTPPAFAPAIRAGQGNARPFLLAADDQFDPGPPPSLDSPTYLTALAEDRAYGSATSTIRTPQQTDVALFWEPAINIQYVQVLRAVLADTHRSPGWQARFIAAFN
jgi:hypothetical protein